MLKLIFVLWGIYEITKLFTGILNFLHVSLAPIFVVIIVIILLKKIIRKNRIDRAAQEEHQRIEEEAERRKREQDSIMSGMNTDFPFTTVPVHTAPPSRSLGNFKCPNCGAPVEFQSDQSFAVCAYCRSSVPFPKG